MNVVWQFIQSWDEKVNARDKGINCKNFKTKFVFEEFFFFLPYPLHGLMFVHLGPVGIVQ